MTRDQADHIAQAIMDDIELSGCLSRTRIAEVIQTQSLRYKSAHANPYNNVFVFAAGAGGGTGPTIYAPTQQMQLDD